MVNHCNINRKSFPKKQSIGIACCRYNPATSKPEILLVQKRYSYNFQTFVFGYYHPNNNRNLKTLFDGMTLSEKMDILSGNYDYLWYKIFLRKPKECKKEFCNIDDTIDPLKVKQYYALYTKKYHPFMEKIKIKDWTAEYKRKSTKFNLPDDIRYNIESCFYCMQKYKYDKLFKNNGRQRIMLLINQSKSIPLLWEIPKGRKNKGEDDVTCAMREFKEETFLPPVSYKIITTKPISINHISQNICYVYKYYIAIFNNDHKQPAMEENIYSMTEIIAVQWLTLDGIFVLECCVETRLYKLCQRILKLFKKKHKNHTREFLVRKKIDHSIHVP